MSLMSPNRFETEIEGARGAEYEVAEREKLSLFLKLASLRKERTLTDVAAEVGIRPEELSKIEAGRTKQIRWETLLGLLEAYQCNVGDILEVRVKVQQEKTPLEIYLTALRRREVDVPARRLEIHEVGEGLDTASIVALSVPNSPSEFRRAFVPAGKRNAKAK